jgi:hypothetical protein
VNGSSYNSFCSIIIRCVYWRYNTDYWHFLYLTIFFLIFSLEKSNWKNLQSQNPKTLQPTGITNHTDHHDYGDNPLTNSQCKPPCRHGRTQTLNNRPGCSVSLFLQHCSEAFVCFVFSRWSAVWWGTASVIFMIVSSLTTTGRSTLSVWNKSKSSNHLKIPISVLVCVVCFTLIQNPSSDIFAQCGLQHENYCSVCF